MFRKFHKVFLEYCHMFGSPTIDDVVVIGKQEGGLYKLKVHPEQALVHDIIEPNELWHRRLAHVH